MTVSFEPPELRDGAASAVYRDGEYCGNVACERHSSGCGWTFTANGPYGNRCLSGWRAPWDAALWIASFDDNGFPLEGNRDEQD